MLGYQIKTATPIAIQNKKLSKNIGSNHHPLGGVCMSILLVVGGRALYQPMCGSTHKVRVQNQIDARTTSPAGPAQTVRLLSPLMRVTAKAEWMVNAS